MPIAVGQRAPAIDQEAHDGSRIKIGEGTGEGITVLYFYPADETKGCTAQACSFRDDFEVFQRAGARVVGVSGDSLDKHRAFAKNHRLPFPLLSDRGATLRKAYDVRRTLGLIPGRVTFVIDAAGVVRHVFDSQLRAKTHVSEALAVVESLGRDG